MPSSFPFELPGGPFELPGGGAPDAGLPSVEQLTRLANEMFSSLPAPDGGAAPTAGVPQLVDSLPPTSLAPAAVPPLPGALSSASLGATPRISPPTPASPLPYTATAVTPPFYFLGEAARSQVLPAAAAGPIGPPFPDATVVRDSSSGHPPLAISTVPSSASLPHTAAPPFYFLEGVQHSQPIAPAPPAQVGEFPPEVKGLQSGPGGFDVAAIRRDFPILQERVNGKPLVWLDNAATTQKPQAVIDRISTFYQTENSNIHRAAHELAARATDAYEHAREKTAGFVNASSTREIVFVRGATEAINLVAQSWGRQNVGEGDEVLVTHLEHHANIVPWQQLCAEKNAHLKVAPVDETGQVILEEYQRLLSHRTKIVAFPQVSNALGTVTPAGEMVEMAQRYGAKILVDGAQSVSHMRTDVQDLDCDWFVFSGHKMFGPTGIGVLFGKADLLDATLPWQGGGNMIQDVTFEKTVYHKAPARFEAGTGNIADAVGLGAAIEYIERIGIENIARYEHELLEYATRGLLTVPGLKLIGTAPDKAGVLSFVLAGFKTEEVGTALNNDGIAVRSGHHCAQPILRRFGLESTVRPSLALYNTCAEIDALVEALLRLKYSR